MSARDESPLAARLAGVVAYGVAMGWLEAVVVAYIRAILGMPRGAETPSAASMLRALGAAPWLMPMEQTREAATIVMLAAVGWLAARRAWGRVGAFLLAFGVWDVAYYAALHRLLGWPTSLATRDLLFLIPPHPWWVQPVWVPVAISCAMIAFGIALMARAGQGSMALEARRPPGAGPGAGPQPPVVPGR